MFFNTLLNSFLLGFSLLYIIFCYSTVIFAARLVRCLVSRFVIPTEYSTFSSRLTNIRRQSKLYTAHCHSGRVGQIAQTSKNLIIVGIESITEVRCSKRLRRCVHDNNNIESHWPVRSSVCPSVEHYQRVINKLSFAVVDD